MAFGRSDSNQGLGKSIADVLSKTPKSKDSNRGFLSVDIHSIVPPADNPRVVFDPERLQELADSIAIHGILQPLVVLKRPAGFEVLSGERRYRAAKLAGLEQVPVVIRDIADDQECAELRLIENIQRQDLNPIELARAYQELIEEHDLTQEELAKRLGKKRSGIANSLRLLTLPKESLQLVADGELSMGHAKVLLGLDNPEQVRALSLRSVHEGLSVRALEQLIKQQAGLAGNLSKRHPKAPHVKELEDNLQRLLSAKVAIKEKGGKGTLTVFFESPAEFQELIGKMDELMRRT